MTRICVVDCETTGLDPVRNQVWEIAIVLSEDALSTEHLWQLPVDLKRAEPGALRINRYYERRTEVPGDPPLVAAEVARLLAGATFCGANPQFDAAFLERFLRLYEQCPAWDYSLLDVKSMAMGKLGLSPPMGKTSDLARLLGINPDEFDRHSALGDARMAKAMYDKCVSTGGDALCP